MGDGESIAGDIEMDKVEAEQLADELAKQLGQEGAPVISEVYSPPRVTAAAQNRPSLGLAPGFALDLTTCDEQGRPWDLSDPKVQRRAMDKYTEYDPYMLIGSPPLHRI